MIKVRSTWLRNLPNVWLVIVRSVQNKWPLLGLEEKWLGVPAIIELLEVLVSPQFLNFRCSPEGKWTKNCGLRWEMEWGDVSWILLCVSNILRMSLWPFRNIKLKCAFKYQSSLYCSAVSSLPWRDLWSGRDFLAFVQLQVLSCICTCGCQYVALSKARESMTEKRRSFCRSQHNSACLVFRNGVEWD